MESRKFCSKKSKITKKKTRKKTSLRPDPARGGEGWVVRRASPLESLLWVPAPIMAHGYGQSQNKLRKILPTNSSGMAVRPILRSTGNYEEAWAEPNRSTVGLHWNSRPSHGWQGITKGPPESPAHQGCTGVCSWHGLKQKTPGGEAETPLP